jgi:nicotinate phosphoribosyltransferase
MRMKLSHDKATYPGAKQVWRFTDSAGKYAQDLIALADEEPPRIEPEGPVGSWRPLLAPVMTQGRLAELLAGDRAPGASTRSESEARFACLDQARAEAANEIKRLPDNLLDLDSAAKYPVVFSDRLTTESRKLEEQIARRRE